MSAIDVQFSVKENLKDSLKKSNVIQFVGPKGSGRMYTVKSLCGEYHVLAVESIPMDDSLQIICNALFDYRNYLNSAEISANFSLGICSRFSIGLSLKNSDHFSKEKSLIKSLKRLSRPIPLFGKETPIIIAIRKEACTERISNFLKLALRTLNVDGDRLKVVYLTDPSETMQNVERVYMRLISESDVSQRKILRQLNLESKILEKLSDDEISFIFNICMNNFSDLLTIIQELNNYVISFENPCDEGDSISRILNKCFVKLSISRLKDILVYCSHASNENKNLTQGELEYLIGVEQRALDRELNSAKELNIIKIQDKYVEIMIKLVSKIAINKSYDRQHEIYKRFIDMFSYLYPSDYYTKSKFALKLDIENSKIAKMQYILQKIRLRHNGVDLNDLPTELKMFVEDYGKAVNLCIKLKYSEAVSIIEKYLSGRNPIIAAEAALITAQAKMKSLDENERTDALNILNTIDIDSCDGNLRYRILMCRISASVHKGKYNAAIEDYNALYRELNGKVGKYPSDELKYNLYVLSRKANMVYNFQSANGYITAAKKYFKQNQSNFTDYFYALCNSLCSNIENMNLDKATEDVEDFEKLQFAYSDVKFKRQYIFDNNKILYEYFSQKLTAEQCATKLYSLLSEMNDYADNFLVASNYAVFLAISGKVIEALNFIETNVNHGTSDAEGVYEYRSIVNSAVMEFILDNSKRDYLIDKLKNIKIDPDQPNITFKDKELNAICEVMRTCNCDSASEWLNNFKSKMPKNRPLNIFEQGFVITPLSNWDDD